MQATERPAHVAAGRASDDAADATPLRRALVALKDMSARLEREREAQHEPIAIIGMACRLPAGANDPDAYWRLLREGRHGVIDVPPDRWDVDAYYDPDPDAPGK